MAVNRDDIRFAIHDATESNDSCFVKQMARSFIRKHLHHERALTRKITRKRHTGTAARIKDHELGQTVDFFSTGAKAYSQFRVECTNNSVIEVACSLRWSWWELGWKKWRCNAMT